MFLDLTRKTNRLLHFEAICGFHSFDLLVTTPSKMCTGGILIPALVAEILVFSLATHIYGQSRVKRTCYDGSYGTFTSRSVLEWQPVSTLLTSHKGPWFQGSAPSWFRGYTSMHQLIFLTGLALGDHSFDFTCWAQCVLVTWTVVACLVWCSMGGLIVVHLWVPGVEYSAFFVSYCVWNLQPPPMLTWHQRATVEHFSNWNNG